MAYTWYLKIFWRPCFRQQSSIAPDSNQGMRVAGMEAANSLMGYRYEFGIAYITMPAYQ